MEGLGHGCENLVTKAVGLLLEPFIAYDTYAAAGLLNGLYCRLDGFVLCLW